MLVFSAKRTPEFKRRSGAVARPPTSNRKEKDIMQESKNEKVNENERAPGMKPRLALYHSR